MLLFLSEHVEITLIEGILDLMVKGYGNRSPHLTERITQDGWKTFREKEVNACIYLFLSATLVQTGFK